MPRDTIEASLRSIYAARAAGDTAGLAAAFAADACYRVVGDDRASPTVCEARGDALHPALTRLNELLPVVSLNLASVIIDGDRAAVEVEARLTFAPTGETFDTRWVNIWQFRDGQPVDVVEYVDTARVVQLFASLPAAPS